MAEKGNRVLWFCVVPTRIIRQTGPRKLQTKPLSRLSQQLTRRKKEEVHYPQQESMVMATLACFSCRTESRILSR